MSTENISQLSSDRFEKYNIKLDIIKKSRLI